MPKIGTPVKKSKYEISTDKYMYPQYKMPDDYARNFLLKKEVCNKCNSIITHCNIPRHQTSKKCFKLSKKIL